MELSTKSAPVVTDLQRSSVEAGSGRPGAPLPPCRWPGHGAADPSAAAGRKSWPP